MFHEKLTLKYYNRINNKGSLMKKIFLPLFIATTAIWASSGLALIKAKCASCHQLTPPTIDMIPDLKYPPMDSVMFHINLEFQDNNKKKAFIVDYALHPEIKKSVCESNKVKKYGVMPSLQGSITKEELDVIADYMMANFPKKSFVDMIKEMKMNNKIKQLLGSPFLIVQEGLPHLTNILVHEWDKAKLGLSDEQKKRLLVIRKETIGAVKKLKPQIKELETEIIEIVVDKEGLKELDGKLETLAKLKTKATKVHIKCIVDTTNILTEEQVAYLLPFWGM